MESPNPETSAKRKRSPVEEAARFPHPPMPANYTQINYQMKARGERLRLIEGDSETFADVLGMIDDYEGVLQRHESLAANLGAKLVSPLLLKSFEKLFDGPIKVLQSSFALEQSPISWLDIVTFARSNLAEFGLSGSSFGTKSCRFWIKGGQVEISEDDYRRIMSGAPERMIPSQPIAEDESAELGTLNILENRLTLLIKKADAVASKARQLKYHLKGRRTAVMARDVADQGAGTNDESRLFSRPAFSAVNSRLPGPRDDEPANLQQDLLDQFLASSRRPSATVAPPRPKISRLPTSEPAALHHVFNNQDDLGLHPNPTTSSDAGIEGQYRVLMAAKIEKFARGDLICPPCDRCRRLKFECTKHLTACSACTKKHAKCSWRDVKDGELNEMFPFAGEPDEVPDEVDGVENGSVQPATGQQANLDPALIAIERSGNAKISPQGQTEDLARRPEFAAEHAMLTQMTPAAATAGHI